MTINLQIMAQPLKKSVACERDAEQSDFGKLITLRLLNNQQLQEWTV